LLQNEKKKNSSRKIKEVRSPLPVGMEEKGEIRRKGEKDAFHGLNKHGLCH